jgi:hypothetical protein
MDATIGRQRCERAPKELGIDKDLGGKYAKKIEEKLRSQREPLQAQAWIAAQAQRQGCDVAQHGDLHAA